MYRRPTAPSSECLYVSLPKIRLHHTALAHTNRFISISNSPPPFPINMQLDMHWHLGPRWRNPYFWTRKKHLEITLKVSTEYSHKLSRLIIANLTHYITEHCTTLHRHTASHCTLQYTTLHTVPR